MYRSGDALSRLSRAIVADQCCAYRHSAEQHLFVHFLREDSAYAVDLVVEGPKTDFCSVVRQRCLPTWVTSCRELARVPAGRLSLLLGCGGGVIYLRPQLLPPIQCSETDRWEGER
jgi:hypothetical protein